MIRRALTILSLIGLLTSLGLWGMSYTVLGWSNGRTILSVSGGAVRYVEFVGLSPTDTKRWWSGFNSFNTALVPRVGWRRGIAGQGGMLHFLLPFWIPSALFAAVFWSCYRPYYLRRRRMKLGLCLRCGYDLTGNVSGVCPECGTKIAVQSERAAAGPHE